MRAAAVVPSPERRELGRLRGLDGLRAIAVAAVVAYHLGVSAVPGGWAGVEVFFVVSGYLITALLVAEWRSHGSISLPAFWARRARRLLPALFAMLLATLAVAAMAFPDQLARLRSDSLAAVAYVTNWYLILGSQPYFATVGRPSPLLHLWSLAIEEQFYLLWPILLGGALLLRGRSAALGLVVAGIVASAAAMALLYVPDADPSRVYYGTDTRASGLLFGALLALVYVPRTDDLAIRLERAAGTGTRLLVEIVAAAGLAAVLAAFVLFDETIALPFRGGLLALDVATVALIAAVVSPAGRLVSGVLELPPVRWLGTRSYAVYLWHWPIIVFTRPGLDVRLDTVPDVVLRLGLTAVAAELSYRFVETPIRRGALGRAWARWRGFDGPFVRRLLRPQFVATVVAVSLVGVLLGTVAGATAPTVTAEVPVTAVEQLVTPPPADPATPAATDRVDGSHAMETPGATATTVPGGSVAPASANDPESGLARDVGSKATASDGTVPYPAGMALMALTRIPVKGPVLAIGESVLIAAAPDLAAVIGSFRLDAKVGRQVSGDVAALEARAAAGELGRVVILDVGNNGYMWGADADRLMAILADVPTVVWVNVSVPREWTDHNNRAIASYASVHPNVRIVDWYAASFGHPELFAPDGVHPNVAGARLFANLVGAALR